MSCFLYVWRQFSTYVQDFILAVIWASIKVLGLPQGGGVTATATGKCLHFMQIWMWMQENDTMSYLSVASEEMSPGHKIDQSESELSIHQPTPELSSP